MPPKIQAGLLLWLVKSFLVKKLKMGRDMCRRSACPWNSDSHVLIPFKKNWESSSRRSTFVCINAIYIQMVGTSLFPRDAADVAEVRLHDRG